VAEVDRMMAA